MHARGIRGRRAYREELLARQKRERVRGARNGAHSAADARVEGHQRGDGLPDRRVFACAHSAPGSTAHEQNRLPQRPRSPPE